MKKIPNCIYEKKKVISYNKGHNDNSIANGIIRNGLCDYTIFKNCLITNVVFEHNYINLKNCVLINCRFLDEYSEIRNSIAINCKNIWNGTFVNSLFLDCDISIIQTDDVYTNINNSNIIDNKVYNYANRYEIHNAFPNHYGYSTEILEIIEI